MNAVLSAKPHATDPQSLFKARYGNYIGGEWVAPRSGQYFDNTTPVTGKVAGRPWHPGRFSYHQNRQLVRHLHTASAAQLYGKPFDDTGRQA